MSVVQTITGPTVLADIGGTNARFALLADGKVGPIDHLVARDYERFTDALGTYLKQQGGKVPGAVLAVAGVVENGRCALTNSPWVIDAAELTKVFGFTTVTLVNDFAALAWSLPRLTGDGVRMLPGGTARVGSPMVVLGPGTGFGVAAYVPVAAGGLVLTTEAGHATLAGASTRDDAAIALMRKAFGHVSAERVLSGPGLENLYRALSAIDGVKAPVRAASEITRDGLSGACPICREAVDMFCGFLGQVAGDVALSFSAHGGVFVAGGITAHVADHLPLSPFRARFEGKGRMRDFVARIPVSLVMTDRATFLGLQALAER
ncbi:MAG TPA: glucokinase [Pseudolabrys sp.]|nr:glucokinase [Pseudolabrys sp.]